jgi:hypothetical protein
VDNRGMSKLVAFAAVLALSTALFAVPGLASAPRQPHGSPARFLSHIVRLLVENRYANAWKWLDTADQKLAPKPVYVACESLTPIPGHLVSLRTVGVGHDRIGVVVHFRLQIGEAGFSPTTVALNAHAVVAGRRWAWILPPARRALYRQGCYLANPSSTP